MKTTTPDSQATPATSTLLSKNYSGPERRLGSADRRSLADERRNPERVMADSSPRRNAERMGRRSTDTWN